MKKNSFLIPLIVTFILALSKPSVNAQKLDSCLGLFNLSGKIPPDSTGYFYLLRGEQFFEMDSLEKAGILFNCSEREGKDAGDNSLLNKVNLAKADLFYEREQFSDALHCYQKALAFAEAGVDTNSIINSLSRIAKLFSELGIADSAFYYCERELELNKAIKNYKGVSDNFRRLMIYPRYTLGGLSESKFVTKGYLDSSYVYALKSKNTGAIAHALANFGVRVFVDEPEKGLRMSRAAIDSARHAGDLDHSLVYALTQSYAPLWKSGLKKEAEANLLEALPLAIESKIPSRLAHIYWLLGMIEKSKNNFDSSLQYLHKAVYFGDKTQISPLKRSIYTTIRRVYKRLGNADSTLYYLERYSVLAQQAHDDAMNKQVALLSAKFKVTEKEEKIDLLDRLNIEKELAIDLQRRFIFILVAAVLSVSALLIFLFVQYKRTQSAYLALTHKNIEINRKEKEIAKLSVDRKVNIEDKLEPLKTGLLQLFEKQKIYLDKDLHLQTAADLLNTNTSYLSALINGSYNCNFTQFVNKYRILEACEILGSEAGDKYSIEGVAEISGFVSKSAFNRAFKEITGLTPSTFRKNIRGTSV